MKPGIRDLRGVGGRKEGEEAKNVILSFLRDFGKSNKDNFWHNSL